MTLVLTNYGNVIELPFKNSQLKEGEEIVATDADGGFLATSQDKDFIWDSLDGALNKFEYSPVKISTFKNHLAYYKNILSDAIQKVEFLENLISAEQNKS